ncbi:phosphodiester glycosidase family protein [Actinacidiphila bryophytorum]|uniref:NAGPA domain-containing protein n=1 Tax=Actinacidiphila bryophytorum TaxID=1436133 RepID=A0A9W4H7I8_9ACTN|nr:phosphodiester glycosidase family protein [Actinacidiphila bryophytorum]MBM9437529.1 phosphodiester glycosidase family protein [Actinacidiphila bryophytorum]MBN6544914.1 phosphodiester glycosidase family protein [Actinacidiphila bryophytorum]CAG7656049.1 NAGPA domain-containing protein [Actinacidiphila bryophytorum]
MSQQTTEPRPEGQAANAGGTGAATGRRRRRLLPWKHRRDLTPEQLRRRRLVTRGITGVCVVCVGTLGWSVGQALTYPGKDSTAARLAEWARDHELGFVVNKLEDMQYSMNPPKVGGDLPADALARMKATQGTVPTPAHVPAQPLVPLRDPMRPLVSPALPGEGVYRTLAAAHGQPIVQGTYVRPDGEHTSYEAAVAWISGKYSRFQLHPGFREPGGTFDVPPTIPEGQRTGLVATWNGGFRITDGGSRGGFYLDGRTAGELRDGAASEVFYRDGSIRIGVWGRDVRMTPDVTGVRQCLELMVDGGRVVPDIGDDSKWGVSDQSRMYVPRSGVGVTAQGDVVMVVGQALSAQTLAQLMQRAGAVRAMPLDMNRAWPSFMSYDGSRTPADPKPTNILDFEDPPDRYYTQATRDFVAVYAR